MDEVLDYVDRNKNFSIDLLLVNINKMFDISKNDLDKIIIHLAKDEIEKHFEDNENIEPYLAKYKLYKRFGLEQRTIDVLYRNWRTDFLKPKFS